MGHGLSVEVALAVPEGSLSFWRSRLARAGAATGALESRFGERALSLSDPHGMKVALVESAPAAARSFAPWDDSPVPAEHQVRGLHGARLWEREVAHTASFLTTILGFSFLGAEDGWQRFVVEGGGSGRVLDVRETPDVRRGAWGVGSIHHLAWRVTDDAHQAAVRQQVEGAGRMPTPVIDRFWFKSVYFKEPGGVLFELATDGPGFAVDEDPAHLGEHLVLPPWLEAQRPRIEAALPPLGAPARA
jgi:glyoxalase family protein